jgi:hypothetical protein
MRMSVVRMRMSVLSSTKAVDVTAPGTAFEISEKLSEADSSTDRPSMIVTDTTADSACIYLPLMREKQNW